MERLDFDTTTRYSSIEGSIHLCRYLNAKNYCQDNKVLDVACGEGYGSALLKKWGAKKVIGVDCSEEAIKKAKKYFKQVNVEYMVADACQLPFEDNSFDLVVSFETIEHVDDDVAFLKEIQRVAKKDAVIIVSCPNDPYYYKDGDDGNPFHKRKYTAYDFKSISTRILGENVHWSYGYGLNGFMSLDESECTHPENKDIDDLKMTDILNPIDGKECYRIQADRYLNNWNANFYVGVWNADVYMPLPSVYFPREFFIEPENPIFADINEWKADYYEKLEICNEILINKIDFIKKKNDNSNALSEITPFQECKEQLEIEKKYLQEKNAELDKENKKLSEITEELEKDIKELKKQIIDKDNLLTKVTRKLSAEKLKTKRTEGLLELADFEKQRLWERIGGFEKYQHDLEIRKEELENCVQEYERYKKSHSYKVMQPIRRIYSALKK